MLRARRRNGGDDCGFPSESAHAIYFTIVVVSPPPLRVNAMMMMTRMTAPTSAQSLQSDTNSDVVLVVVLVLLVLLIDESWASAAGAMRTAATANAPSLRSLTIIDFMAVPIT
jgi:hypothetical protein